MEERRKVTNGDIFKAVSNFVDVFATGLNRSEDDTIAYQKKMNDATKVFRRPKPKSVLVNGDYTTVVWKDGSATVVKKMEGEEYDLDKAILYAIVKKYFTTSSSDLNEYLGSFDKVKVVKTKSEKDKKGSKGKETKKA